MQKTIDLICLGDRPVDKWPHGRLLRSNASVAGVHALIGETLDVTRAEAWLFWEGGSTTPKLESFDALLRRPVDVWHVGLLDNMGGRPTMLDFVNPTWMYNRDPEPNQTATSWRVSLKACLVRVSVLRQLGNIDPHFDTLTGATLEWGYRWLLYGAIVRNAPTFFGLQDKSTRKQVLTVYDELRFIRNLNVGRWVYYWVLYRALMNGFNPFSLLQAHRRLRSATFGKPARPYSRPESCSAQSLEVVDNTVSILIPTVERNTYLRNELEQLRRQTVQPREIIIVDQTPEKARDNHLIEDFPELPLRVFYQDTQGQCTAWNKALQEARGDYLLFLGDDADEISRDFLARLLSTMHQYDADLVACRVDEVGVEPLPECDRFLRVADTFPIALVQRKLFVKTGLYDYAFDRGARADQDLAIRFYLAGGLSILDPDIRILHLRAPRGGLRKHGVRKVTYASSRKKLTHRNLVMETEIYIALRYFTPRQLREMIWLRIMGTFSIRGSKLRKALKVVVSLIYLPHTLWETRRRYFAAKRLIEEYPKIPHFIENEVPTAR